LVELSVTESVSVHARWEVEKKGERGMWDRDRCGEKVWKGGRLKMTENVGQESEAKGKSNVNGVEGWRALINAPVALLILDPRSGLAAGDAT
jgi:hypothetical protein